MRAEPPLPRSEGDLPVYGPLHVQPSQRTPLLDLRTRLVLWGLCLLFVGLLYLGLNATGG